MEKTNLLLLIETLCSILMLRNAWRHYRTKNVKVLVLSYQVLQSDNILANEHELEPNVALKYCWSFLYCYLCNHERTIINKLTVTVILLYLSGLNLFFQFEDH